MKKCFSIELNNILHVILLLLIGYLCETYIMLDNLLLLPIANTCVAHDLNKFDFWYAYFYNKMMYPYLSIIYFFLCSIYTIVLKIFAFPKIVIYIENLKEKTKTSEIISYVHKYKTSVLFIFIIFSVVSVFFTNMYSDTLNLDNRIAYFFFIPLHYLVLYLYWFYKDKNNIKREDADSYRKEDVYIELIKYVLITNPFFIIISWFSMFNILLNLFPLIDKFIIFIFLSIIVLLILFYLFIIIKLFIKIINFVINISKKIRKQIR